jgi:hypothetical protein
MKTAVILSGNVRTWERCRDLIVDALRNYDCDFFVSTYDLQYGYHPCVRQTIGFYDDRLLTDDEIAELFASVSPKGLRIDRHVEYGETVSRSVSPSFPASQHCSLSQFFKIKDGMRLVDEYERLNGFRYDVVVKTRCDLRLSCIPKFDVATSVLIDSGNVYPNDCFFATNRDAADRLIHSCVSHASSPIDTRSMMVVPHGLFLMGLEDIGMRVVASPIIDCVVRQNRSVKYPALDSPFGMPVESIQ